MSEILLIKTIKAAKKDRARELSVIHWEIKALPEEIGELTELEELRLKDNELTSLPKGIRKLKHLRILWLSDNQFKELPVEMRELTNLQELHVDFNQLTELPAWIGQLRSLKRLDANKNQLAELPTELGELTNLTKLRLSNNQLTSIPAELLELTNLTELYLAGNQLTSVPAELGRMTNLTYLHLNNNQLMSLPEELGNLTQLSGLDLGNNPLESPPPEVVRQGTKAVLVYLRGQLKEKKKQWVSKMLVIGEGGVGKTSLLRALRGEEFVEGLETTHGIGVDKFVLEHPSETDVTMELNTWDFGGQQIYHATHQFFLTNRSLFVLVWDARQGWEAGKLYKWMDTIHALAPGAPVIIVGNKVDERDADLPLEDLLKRYDEIVGHYEVSNKTGEGIGVLREAIADIAASLPLMGEEWPASWLDAAEKIRGKKEHYISPKELYNLMGKNKVTGKSANVLAQWLHDLGDILYYRENDELNDLVILDAEWITDSISRVLESKEVIGKEGIFTRQHMNELWADVEDEKIREHLLRLMEEFDLSYRTLENREISLVVERLPLDPPDYEEKWNEIKERENCKEISMKFELSSVPAGIPTWFIARSHRFTTHTHWRLGALFTDGKERRHLGLIEAFPHEKIVRLTVRGPVPNNFFVLLRDGLELTLARFPGLKINRTVPCPGHEGKECNHEFEFADLHEAIAIDEPVLEFQCPKSRKFVSVPGLLYGLDILTQNEVMKRLDALNEAVVTGDERIIIELLGLKELTERQFLSLFNSVQRLEESHCPNVFAVLPKGEEGWLKNIFGQEMVLQLYCQAPGEWHPTYKGGHYDIKQPAEFFRDMGPYIVKLAKVIRYAAPVAGAAAGLYAGPIGAVMGAGIAKKLAGQVKLMEELAKKLGDEREITAGGLLDDIGKVGRVEEAEGAALRALRKLLDEVDPKQNWGGLKKILTPEGHYLWLCAEHAEEYKR